MPTETRPRSTANYRAVLITRPYVYIKVIRNAKPLLAAFLTLAMQDIS